MASSAADLDVLDLLATGQLHLRAFLAGASNHTLLCEVGDAANGVAAVYKPRAGERPLHDFPDGSLCQREVAAYQVSAFLGWGIVPPTVLRDGPMGVGSVQLFVPHDPDEHYFVLVDDEAHHHELARIAVFDLIVNNADRKGSHILRAHDDGRLRGIDHGVTFHPLTKLRTVVWDLAEAPVDAGWCADARRLADALTDPSSAVRTALHPLLSELEVEMLRRRTEAVGRLRTLPTMPTGRRPYPWPPL